MDDLGKTEKNMLLMDFESINCMDTEEWEIFDPGILHYMTKGCNWPSQLTTKDITLWTLSKIQVNILGHTFELIWVLGHSCYNDVENGGDMSIITWVVMIFDPGISKYFSKA